MNNKGKKISSSLALATAAFLSAPLTVNAQEFSPCSALRSARVPKRVRIEGKGPWPVRTDEKGDFVSGHITTNLWNSARTMPVRVGAEVMDVRVGKRIDCLEARLAPGEGTQLRIQVDKTDYVVGKDAPLLGVRIIVIPDPVEKPKKKISLPRVSGSIQSNVLYNNENITEWE